jgi:GT2 family glycosyltransferase
MTRQVVIWDNASEDDTKEYLASVDDPRIRIVEHGSNIGTSAYAPAVALTSAPYIVELDDDVIEAPQHWDETLLNAFEKIPGIGILAADLKEDPNDSAYCYLRYLKETRNVFERREINGIGILEGPTPGGCAMTSREIYDRVGGFQQQKKLIFWHEDAAYVRQVRKRGYRTAILEELKVWHAGSPHYSKPSRAKVEFHEHNLRRKRRKDPVKRAILRIPLAATLNRRYRWFAPPDDYEPPDFGRAWE